MTLCDLAPVSLRSRAKYCCVIIVFIRMVLHVSVLPVSAQGQDGGHCGHPDSHVPGVHLAASGVHQCQLAICSQLIAIPFNQCSPAMLLFPQVIPITEAPFFLVMLYPPWAFYRSDWRSFNCSIAVLSTDLTVVLSAAGFWDTWTMPASRCSATTSQHLAASTW